MSNAEIVRIVTIRPCFLKKILAVGSGFALAMAHLPTCAMPDDSSVPQPTPPNYQRTTGGDHLRWQPPTPQHLQEMLPAYEVLSIIGQGGMGAVYKGRQKSLDRIIAIKILPPEAGAGDMQFIERFRNEARTMAKMNHPAIVHVYDFGETCEGQFYIVMEFIDGTDVAKMIQSQGKLPENYALSITAHVCDALGYAHTHGVVHRDIKPANILINMEGQVKVADFGLAKATDPKAMGLTQTNMTMGTPDFVSPEALTPGVPLDGRADLYAVGVMLYNMLTGSIPRGAFRMPSITLQTDARFDKIILKAMEMDRENRYQTALDLRRDLDVILTTPAAKSGGQTLPAQQAAQPQKPMGKSPSAPQQRPAAGAATPGRTAPAASKPADGKPSAIPATAPAKKSNAVMIYGIAAAVVVAGGAFMFAGGGKKPAPTPKAVAEKKSEPKKPESKPATPPPAAAKPKPPETKPAPAPASLDSGKEMWVDGLAQWFSGTKSNEAFRQADGALKASPAGFRLEPLPPSSPLFRDQAVRVRARFSAWPNDVDLRLYVRRVTGAEKKDYFLTPQASKQQLILSYDDSGSGKYGQPFVYFPLAADFDPKAVHTLELRVVGDLLTASVDGKKVGEKRDGKFADGHPGISAKNVVIESFEYANLDPGSSAPPAPIASAAVDARDGWQDALALVNLSRDDPKGEWKSDGHSLKMLSGSINFCPIPIQPPQSYDLRVRMRREGKPSPVSIGFSKEGHSGFFTLDTHPIKPEGPLTAGLELLKGKYVNESGKAVERSEWLSDGRLHEIILRVRDEGLAVSLDGQEIYRWRGNWADVTPLIGRWPTGKASSFAVGGWRGKMTFEDISWRPVVEAKDSALATASASPSAPSAPTMPSAAPAALAPAAPVPAPAAPAAPADPRLAQLAAGFKARLEADALQPFNTALAALNTSYVTNGVSRARAAAKAKGSLVEVTALDDEKAAIEKGRGVPDEDDADTIEALKTLRSTYRTAYAKLTAERDARAAPLYDLYLNALDAYIAELTQTDKIADARKVQVFRDDIALQKPGAVAAEPTASEKATAAAPASSAASKPAVRAPKMSERELAEWAIATGGFVDVSFGTPPVTKRIAIASELPRGRFIITLLRLECAKVPGRDLSPLASAQDTENVFLENSMLPDKTYVDLTPLRQMPKLRTLTTRDLDAAAVDVVASLEELDTLYARNLPEGSLEKIAKLKHLVTFESESILGPGIAALRSCKQLRNIMNGSNPNVSDDDVRALVAALPGLERLRIAGPTAITSACLPSLLSLKSLNYLELHSNELDDSVIETLAKLPRLEILNLNSSKIIGSNFEELKKISSLRELYLDGCSVTDDALDALAHIKGLTKLQLRRTKVTDAGIAKLKAARPGFNVSK